MILLRKLTPNVYYDHSRDFQLIGRLYDFVLNSVKTNTDLLYSLPISDDSDTQLLDLMTMTFGFQSKHNYNIQQLKSLCACFARVIRNKGNIQAIRDACNALVGAEGITESIYIDVPTDNPANIRMFVPQSLSDLNLLKDLLNYILPAGMTCQIIKTLKTTKQVSTTMTVTSHLTAVVGQPIRDQVTSRLYTATDSAASATSPDTSKINSNEPYTEPTAFINTTVIGPYTDEEQTNV